MRRFLFLIILLVPVMLPAQLAIISDPDGYVNVRSGKGKEFPVVDTLRSGRLVYTWDTLGDWWQVWPRMPYKEHYREVQFVHRSRLTRVETLPVKKQHEIIIPVFKGFVKAKIREEKNRDENRSATVPDTLQIQMGPMPGDYFEEALVSAAAIWKQRPDSILMHAAFEALARSGGSASEQRTFLMAKIAQSRPELYRRMACRFPDYAHDELIEGASSGFAMNSYPGGVFSIEEENRVLQILYTPCSDNMPNPDALDSIRNKNIRNEIESLIFEGVELEGVPLPEKLNLQQAGTVTTAGNKASISGFGYQFDLVQQLFEKEHYYLNYRSGNPKELISINGNRVWGTDGGLPKTALKSVKVTYEGKYYTMIGGAVSSLYQPDILVKTSGTFQFVSVYRSADRQRVYLRMYGGDGAGGYVAVWIFCEGTYRGRVVEHGF